MLRVGTCSMKYHPKPKFFFGKGAGGEEVWSWEGRMEVVGVRKQSKLGVGTCSMGNHPWGRTSGAWGEVYTGVHLVSG